MMNLSEELTWRGFVNQTTFKDISELNAQKRTFYWGVDPSAASMQIGNLAAAMMARVFIKHGYKPMLLVGGATGMIGDPDGKAQERELKSLDEIARNKAGIVQQYKQVFGDVDFEVVDNYEWFKNMNYLTFLRDVGKHVPLRQMIARDFVQSRLGEDGAGISYAEFSYSLIQGYDFLWLAENKGVSLQLSGADQWGNSIAGVDLIRRKLGQEAHVWTCPLIINKATGIKFGKTEGGAVWLDPELTSPYKFYQFWLNVDDQGVIDYMKIYTALDKDRIDAIETEFAKNTASRSAQKILAYEVTSLVHGKAKAETVVHASDALFNSDKLSAQDVSVLRQELATVQAADDIYQVIVDAGLASSKSEARQFVSGGAISVNGQKISAESNNPFTESVNLIKRGKNTFALVER
jgi:tyrosyl-tRNA synthetase